MPDYDAADEVADEVFALIARDNRLSFETNPDELLTIAMQLAIAVMKAIENPDRRKYACNILADKIRDLPDQQIWKDRARITLH